MYRLEHSVLGSTTNLALTYDATGNITSRTDLAGGATWTYGSSRRHAVTQAGSAAYTYSYDANGNVTGRGGYSIDWTSFDHPSTINGAGGESVSFSYNQDHQRWRAAYNGSAGVETTYFIGGLLEKVVTAGSNYDFRHYIMAGDTKVAVYSRTTAGANTLRYLGTDHIGSVDSILNDDGTAYVKESFTAFGARRNQCTWSGPPTQGTKDKINAVTRHGYTWHMALADMGLNDMNGRIQDALTGRFLSPDPHVPEPLNTQAYNRFSYVGNNPLSFTDPTGFDDYFWGTIPVYGTPPQSGVLLSAATLGTATRQGMNDERASSLDPRIFATTPFSGEAPLQEVKVTAPKEKPPQVAVKVCRGPNCVPEEPQGDQQDQKPQKKRVVSKSLDLCYGSFSFAGREIDLAEANFFGGALVESSVPGMDAGHLWEGALGGEVGAVGLAVTQSFTTGKWSGFGFAGVGISAGPLAGVQVGIIFSPHEFGFYYEGHRGWFAGGGGGAVTSCGGNDE